MVDKNPFEIARETLKQLTVRKLAPTPINYQRLYSEIAGQPIEPAFPADRLRDIAVALPTKTPGQQKQRGLLESAINQLNWDGVKSALMAYGGFSPPAPDPGKSVNLALAEPAKPVITMVEPAESVPLTAPALTADFFSQIARMVEYALPALGQDDERFLEQTQTLVKALRQPNADAVTVKQMLASYGHRLSFAAEDQAEIKNVLLKLLHLIIENISHLSLDDGWLKGQVDALMNVCVPPLTLRRLDDVEQRLKDVIFKQTEAKSRSVEAHEEMRQMLATFVDRLASMSESTGSFHDMLETSARLIEQAKTQTVHRGRMIGVRFQNLPKRFLCSFKVVAEKLFPTLRIESDGCSLGGNWWACWLGGFGRPACRYQGSGQDRHRDRHALCALRHADQRHL